MQAARDRARRFVYVKNCGARNLVSPFLDANWDHAALMYIETGDESLKKDFPLPKKNV
jgi:hypothetical protein